MEAERAAQIRALVEPLLAERELELIELTVVPHGRRHLVRLLVDTVGGVTLQECARVNERIGALLESTDLIEGSYTVEVSSPGLDRPLATKRDFERAIGEEVVLEAQGADGKVRPVEGMVLAVQEQAVVLQQPAGNTAIPFSAIRSARKSIRW